MSALPDDVNYILMPPGLHAGRVSFRTVTNFLEGYDMACRGGLLSGLREWLVVRADGGNDIAWPSIVTGLGFPGRPPPPEDEWTLEDHQRLVGLTFELLGQYVHDRLAPDGPKDIFPRYEAWLSNQDCRRARPPVAERDERRVTPTGKRRKRGAK